jgi:hypothetical protein
MALTKEQVDFIIDCCDPSFRRDNINRDDLKEPLQTWLQTAIDLHTDPDNHYTSTIDSIQETWEMALYMGVVYGVEDDALRAFLEAKFVIVGVDLEGEFRIFVGNDGENGPEFISIVEDVDRNRSIIDDEAMELIFSQQADLLAFNDGYLTEIDVAVVVSPAKIKNKAKPALENAQAQANKE